MRKLGTFLIEKTLHPSEYRRNPTQSHIRHMEQGKPYEFLREVENSQVGQTQGRRKYLEGKGI